MTRSFSDRRVAPEVVDELVDAARRAPSAGNTHALEFLVLEGPAQVGEYWEVTLPPSRRASFRWPGLLRAPVLVLLFVDPEAYPARYREPDKIRTGLGGGPEAWPVPYWWVDGGMAAMALLLAAEDHGLGALFFGLFEHEAAVRATFGVPEARRAVGAIALGHRSPEDRPSGSAARGRPSLDAVLHRVRWAGGGQARPVPPPG